MNCLEIFETEAVLRSQQSTLVLAAFSVAVLVLFIGFWSQLQCLFCEAIFVFPTEHQILMWLCKITSKELCKLLFFQETRTKSDSFMEICECVFVYRIYIFPIINPGICDVWQRTHKVKGSEGKVLVTVWESDAGRVQGVEYDLDTANDLLQGSALISCFQDTTFGLLWENISPRPRGLKKCSLTNK